MRINDTDLLTCVARLSQNTDFVQFMEKIVKKEYADALDKCIIEDKPGRFQGKAQILKDLIETVDEARSSHRQRSNPIVDMGQSL